MMQNDKQNPAALAGANRVKETKVSSQDFSTSPEANFQAAFIAARYRLSPCFARLICELAQLGGRLV